MAADPDPISTDALSDLIARIYDCAIDPARWPVAMEAIRTTLDFELSTLNLQRLPSFEVVLNLYTNIPEQYAALINDAGQDVIEQWGGFEKIAALPMDEPGVLSRVNPDFDPATTTNRYYHAFARPQGLTDVLAVMLARDAGALGSIAWGRHERAGPIGDHEVAVARLLTPHLQRAATINRLLDLSAVAKASFEAVIDRLAVPIMLVDHGLTLLHANPAAVRLLDDRGLIQVRQGVLRARSPGVSQALAAAVAEADEAAIGRKGFEIPTRAADGAVGVLHVLPLNPSRTPGLGAARAAIFVGQGATGIVPPTGLIGALFGLTAAETRVFACISSGLTVPAAARELAVAPATVKTHLLRLYDKTGVRRREELIQLAASLSLPIEA